MAAKDKEETVMGSRAPLVDRVVAAVDMVARGKEVAAMEDGVKVKYLF